MNIAYSHKNYKIGLPTTIVLKGKPIDIATETGSWRLLETSEKNFIEQLAANENLNV